MHDITILNHVVLTLYAHLTCLTDSSLRAILDIVIILDHLSTDKALLKVGMDDTSALGAFQPFL